MANIDFSDIDFFVSENRQEKKTRKSTKVKCEVKVKKPEIKKEEDDDDYSDVFKVDGNYNFVQSIVKDEPIFLRNFVEINECQLKDYIKFNWMQHTNIQLEDLILCPKCGVNLEILCFDCKPFKLCNINFILEFKNIHWMFPAPTNFSVRMFNFVKNLYHSVHTYYEDKINIIKKFSVDHKDLPHVLKTFNMENSFGSSVITTLIETIKQNPTEALEKFDEDYDALLIKFINTKYKRVSEQPISYGNIKEQTSGKNSYIRRKILGSVNNAIRLVSVIDTTLGPDEIIIPKSIFTRMNFMTQYAVVNRSPSINSECIFVQKVRCEDDDLPVIKISVFLADGLHCDQDGDELNLFILEHEDVDLLSFSTLSLYKELYNQSFAFGDRCTFDYCPRYSFGQYYQYVMYLEHDNLCSWIPFYKDIPTSKADKPDFLMNLLCSSLNYGAVKTISDIIEYFKHYIIPSNTISEFLTNEPSRLTAVYESKSKGSVHHHEKHLQYIFNRSPSKYHKEAVTQFNTYIVSANKVSTSGRFLFTKLYGLSQLTLVNDTLLYINKAISKNLHSNPLLYSSQYNKCSIALFISLLKKQDDWNCDLKKFNPEQVVNFLVEPNTTIEDYSQYNPILL